MSGDALSDIAQALSAHEQFSAGKVADYDRHFSEHDKRIDDHEVTIREMKQEITEFVTSVRLATKVVTIVLALSTIGQFVLAILQYLHPQIQP